MNEEDAMIKKFNIYALIVLIIFMLSGCTMVEDTKEIDETNNVELVKIDIDNNSIPTVIDANDVFSVSRIKLIKYYSNDTMLKEKLNEDLIGEENIIKFKTNGIHEIMFNYEYNDKLYPIKFEINVIGEYDDLNVYWNNDNLYAVKKEGEHQNPSIKDLHKHKTLIIKDYKDYISFLDSINIIGEEHQITLLGETEYYLGRFVNYKYDESFFIDNALVLFPINDYHIAEYYHKFLIDSYFVENDELNINLRIKPASIFWSSLISAPDNYYYSSLEISGNCIDKLKTCNINFSFYYW